MSTVVTEIQGALNTKPLCYIYDDSSTKLFPIQKRMKIMFCNDI